MLELHPNDNAREGRPGLWIFQGRAVIVPVIAVGAFVGLFRILDSIGIDWWLSVIISVLPGVAMALFVWFFVRDRPPSYAIDLLAWRLFRLKQRLWRYGLLDRPPAFWIKAGDLPVVDHRQKETV